MPCPYAYYPEGYYELAQGVFIYAPLILAVLLVLPGRWWAPGQGEHGV
jgi:hypothetical protein